MFEKIKMYYERGVWDEHRVHNAVVRGVITPEQFEGITGKAFSEE